MGVNTTSHWSESLRCLDPQRWIGDWTESKCRVPIYRFRFLALASAVVGGSLGLRGSGIWPWLEPWHLLARTPQSGIPFLAETPPLLFLFPTSTELWLKFSLLGVVRVLTFLSSRYSKVFLVIPLLGVSE